MEALFAIRQLRSIAKPLLGQAPGNVLFPVHFTFNLVLERLESSLGSLELLLENDVIRHYHAAGLICRNILSDVLSTGYIIKSSAIEIDQSQDIDEDGSDDPFKRATSVEGQLHENLYALYHDDIQRMDRIVDLYRKAGILSDEDIQRYREKNAMPDSIYKLIRDYAEISGTKSFPSNTEVITRLLKSDKKDPWVRELQLAFDIWVYFSKYEHLGWHAYDFTRDLDKNTILSRLKSIVRLAALLQSSCHEMLEQKQALAESMAIYKELLPFSTNSQLANG